MVGGERFTEKCPKATFLGDGNVLHIHWSGDYMGVFNYQNSLNIMILMCIIDALI